MFGVSMYHSVETLVNLGKSNAEIARTYNIHRNTVAKIRKRLEKGYRYPQKLTRKSDLDQHKNDILDYMDRGLSAVLIYKKLQEKKGLNVGYSAVRNYVRKLKTPECYIPLVANPGEEGQVDFGYAGLMNLEGKQVKVWVFCMTLSYSRYAYYELVLDQTTNTFINCHINAFKYFGGVPQSVKIDNLRSAVLEASFYEPIFQIEYNNFLKHYQTAGITCRVRRGQDKGKVESGIKYVKVNFVKGLETKDFIEAQRELKTWNKEVCNKRIHGTTRKIPFNSFHEKEKEHLKPLPLHGYEVYQVETRKVHNYGHIFYKYNYYSVPSKYIGETLKIKSNGKLLKVYKDFEKVATHAIECKKEGMFITQELHKPESKQRKHSSYYFDKAESIGPHVLIFAKKLQKKSSHGWHKALLGIFDLKEKYNSYIIDKACQRAIYYNNIGFRVVREIIEQDLYLEELNDHNFIPMDGYSADLSMYDNLF